MLKLSQLLDAKRRDSSDTNTESAQARLVPQSPLTVNSSAPVSPTVSLFSAKGHTRLSSSVSSLVSSSALGISVDSPSKAQLTGVKEEEPIAYDDEQHCEPPDLEEEYFQHFEQGTSVADDSFFAFVDSSDGYDLTDAGMDMRQSIRTRGSDSVSMKGISRINSQISTLSSRWRAKLSDSPVGHPRSRANSSASSIAMNCVNPICRVDPCIPPSPAATLFEEQRISVSSETRPISIDRGNTDDADDSAPQATTPLLPPFMGDGPSNTVSKVTSPLQSPSVADTSEQDRESGILLPDPRFPGLPSPPLSSKPSVSSFSRPRTNTIRVLSGDTPPLILSDPKDEWAHKLGHANFTIQPEPYVPEICDAESFRQLRADWDLARCNFARHLVRTGEHYGITSNIYRLTEDKWEAINKEWKQNYDAMVIQLDTSGWEDLGLTRSTLHPCGQIKLPRLNDNDKFPELGDEEIVGPMSVAPAGGMHRSCHPKSQKKRNFFRFFQDLVSRS